MAQNDLDIKPLSTYTNLITFTYGASVARYVAGARNYTDGDTFTALPCLEIDLKKQTGSAKDEPITVRLSPVVPLITVLNGFSFTKIDVVIEEVDVLAPATRRVLFKGYLAKIVGNKNGRNDLIEIEMNGLRAPLASPLGIPANNTCSWVFGDKNCAIALGALMVATTITSIPEKTKIVIASAANVPPYFFRGFVQVDGLRIMVRDHIAATELILVDPVPPEWAGAACSIAPGCNKTIGDCRDKWSNETQFGGFGLAIPKFHPLFEIQ